MIPFVSDFITHFNNARACVKQIKNGEWVPEYNPISRTHHTASRNGYRLWLSNGPFFCEVDEFEGERCSYAFGWLFRHYVWFAAARSLKIKADSSSKGAKHHPLL